MGMFDSVFASCPECLEKVEFQSKAGECRGHYYSTEAVPYVIATALEGTSRECPVCKSLVTLKFSIEVPQVVRMDAEVSS